MKLLIDSHANVMVEGHPWPRTSRPSMTTRSTGPSYGPRSCQSLAEVQRHYDETFRDGRNLTTVKVRLRNGLHRAILRGTQV